VAPAQQWCLPRSAQGAFDLKVKVWMLALLLAATFGIDVSCTEIVNNPFPTLTSLSPSSVVANSPGFTLTLTGKGFSPQSVVLFNGTAITLTTIFLNENEITTMVSPTQIEIPETIAVTIFTPTPGGGTSGTVNLTVTQNMSSLPQITSISPATAFAGSGSVTLTVNGSGFNPSSIVSLDNNNLTTVYSSGAVLFATVPTATLQSAQVGTIVVTSPPPGGGSSNAVAFDILNAQPSVSEVAPNVETAGGTTNLTLSVDGAGFSLASVVVYNGMPQTTTFAASNQVSFTIFPSNYANAGTVPVQVTNPSPGGGVSNSMAFSVVPTTSGGGLPELVDVGKFGQQANFGIGSTTGAGPATSSTGQFVAYTSISTNLVSSDTNGVADVFLTDTCLSTLGGCTPSTLLVSLTTGGSQANGPSSEPSIDTTGRYVAFSSTATNLAPSGFTNGTELVYWRDTCSTVTTSCSPRTLLASVAPDGVTAANNSSFNPAISPDGRYVAFASIATNIGPGNPTGTQEIYVYDTCNGVTTGCTPAVSLLSVASDNVTPADGVSQMPLLTNNAQYAVFVSTATTLGPANPSGAEEVFERTTCIGVTSGCTPVNILVSTPDGVTAATGASIEPAVDMVGRFVAFASTATNLGVTSTVQQIYMRDTCTGVSGCTPVTSLVSTPDGVTPGNLLSEEPSLDSTGEYAAFASNATNLVASDTNGFEDIFVRNTCSGNTSSCTTSTVLASVTGAANPQPGMQGNGASTNPAITGNDMQVLFISNASNLVLMDTNGQNDIFLANTTF
jgi:hypothetical protein